MAWCRAAPPCTRAVAGEWPGRAAREPGRRSPGGWRARASRRTTLVPVADGASGCGRPAPLGSDPVEPGCQAGLTVGWPTVQERAEERGLTRAQQARRQRVVDSAMTLALEGGYDAVQMRDVAARAHVAMGTVYRYFSSKDHLLA